MAKPIYNVCVDGIRSSSMIRYDQFFFSLYFLCIRRFVGIGKILFLVTKENKKVFQECFLIEVPFVGANIDAIAFNSFYQSG